MEALDLEQGVARSADERKDAAPSARRSPMSPVAQGLYRLRRRRERLFPTPLFSEPGWDLLLDLFIAESEGKRVSITSACIAAAVPTTTAVRCLKQLESLGFV